MANICGNFAIEGECGTCKYFCIVGVCTGVCEANDYEDCMTTDDACDIYEKRT